MTECDRCGKHIDEPIPMTVEGVSYELCDRCDGVVGRRTNAPRPEGLRTYGRVINRHSGP